MTARRRLFLLVVLALSAPPARAQQRDSVAAQRRDSLDALKRLTLDQLMNIEVVSVAGRPERLSETASAIQVITHDDIRRSGATSLPEALRLASNLQVAQLDARQWAVSARGFNSTSANKLLVLIDGRTVYTPLFSGVFWDVQDVLLSDVDRIEVISGPGATLWGANAVNGVINVITKDAKDTGGLLVTGGGGSELRGLGSARYGGGLGAHAQYRIYGKAFSRDPTLLSNGQAAPDGWHMGQGGFRLDWHAPDSNHLSLHGDWYDGRIAQASPGHIAVSGGNVMAKWAHPISAKSEVTAQAYYDRTHRDIPGTFGEDLDIYDIDLRHHAVLGARHDVVWGVGYRLINDHVTNTAALAFLPPHVARQWFTAFVQDEIPLRGERVHLTLGTKIEHNDYTGFEIQPSGRVNWTFSPSRTLWAAISRAVRTPSRIDRELFIPGQPPYFLAGGPGFRSEQERAYELGYRHQQGALVLTVASFYSRYHGLRSLEQVNPPNPTPIVIGNGQDGESYGAELTAQYGVSDRWRLRGGYTELRVHIWPNPGSTDTSRGATESQAPDRQLFLHSSLDLPAHLQLDGGFRYVGEISRQQVPAYAELNARLTWQPIAALDLSIVGQNLLHERHAEFGTTTARRQIERGVYGMAQWHF
ncbi:MAG TPA: TonB-dependent receptor [Gemmatimonadales bacterium]|jgi:iron complex outermembrane receptor protein|nr:TonB-dependent receptor [Gemmatimonadales bacterium]